LYNDNSDFANVCNACETSAFEKFYRLDEYLFKENHLCVPLSSMRELFIHEAHEHFYWQKIKKDVQCICDKCITCKKAKSRTQSHGLYTPLPVPKKPWVDISKDFVLGLVCLA